MGPTMEFPEMFQVPSLNFEPRLQSSNFDVRSWNFEVWLRSFAWKKNKRKKKKKTRKNRKDNGWLVMAREGRGERTSNIEVWVRSSNFDVRIWNFEVWLRSSKLELGSLASMFGVEKNNRKKKKKKENIFRQDNGWLVREGRGGGENIEH